MRVTKTVREYIAKEVNARLTPKYEADKAEAERQRRALENFKDACNKAAQAAYDSCFDELFPDIADFAEDIRKHSYKGCIYSNPANLRVMPEGKNVHDWQYRKNVEAKSIIDDIVVTLELGGTKAELMEMLNNI